MANFQRKNHAVTRAAESAALVAPSERAATLAARSWARVEEAAQAALASTRVEQSLRIVASQGHFSALIRAGNTTVQIEDGSYAVTTEVAS